MVCFLLGSRVHISERLQNILKGEGEQSDVIVHVGTNDTGVIRDASCGMITGS